MTIYASRTPESMNSDPEPWALRHYDGDVRPRGWDACQERPEWYDRENSLDYLPRPEFTPKTTHPANPILVEFREYGEAGAALWLETLNGYSSTYDYVDVVDDAIDAATPDQIDHARRVLTRLANFR